MLIFDIKRYSINDGPGIRITIFMKGCPLSCVWCHNPEGLSECKEKLYTKNRCISCGICVESCPQKALSITSNGILTDRFRCIRCGICVEQCPAMAMEISGKEYSPDVLIKEIEKETIFMDNSGGGVTFCGGEPLYNHIQLIEMLKICGTRGIHRAVDTSLFAKRDTVLEVMDNCELFIVDLKHIDSDKHRLFCGVPNELILSNISMVTEAGGNLHIRIPLIEGVNTDIDNIKRSAEYLAGLNWVRRTVNLLPYHEIGKGKCDKLGKTYNPSQYLLETPSQETIQRCSDIFADHEIKVIIGG